VERVVERRGREDEEESTVREKGGKVWKDGVVATRTIPQNNRQCRQARRGERRRKRDE
jgi:hypothetical protein